MKKKTVSIKTIAANLNISVTTVSFVLNGKAKEKHISKELTQKVLDYAKAVNYKPNQIAQSLRTGKSKILVFMVEDISNSFFSKLARIIEDIAYDKGYKVIFCSNENDDEKSIDLISLFKNRQVDGFIIVPSPGIKSTIEELIEENIPVVLLDRYFAGLDCNSVVIDNEEATFNATTHLIQNQFKNIGFITTDSDQTQMKDRLLGYEKAIINNGLKPQILKIPYNETSDGKAKTFIKNFMVEAKDLDAVFFATNYLTQTGLEFFKETDPQLIQDLGIITFDDNELFKIYSPTITAVSQPLVEISNELMKLLLPLLKRKDIKEEPTKNILLQAELKIRESSGSKV
ncbi:substrate-binding domain-containing protein [Flavobacterium sp. GA093]|uniref:Substrate-binding domain-containing protein n=1 Tax=Flavobacterium hydrocarbonoxydans TaxID=2683249 RepID=A0A6I4NUC5_9FLAO|nr:LacI family DNA-binding transcriptional regulator [Flavobacterium hydrocarbonoxydans]MWB96095.1 substrate-binding domain-containing protein [Flavobacterium hydrocarbonoxydans]